MASSALGRGPADERRRFLGDQGVNAAGLDEGAGQKEVIGHPVPHPLDVVVLSLSIRASAGAVKAAVCGAPVPIW